MHVFPESPLFLQHWRIRRVEAELAALPAQMPPHLAALRAVLLLPALRAVLATLLLVPPHLAALRTGLLLLSGQQLRILLVHQHQ